VKRSGRYSLMLMLLPVAYLAVTILFGGRTVYFIDGAL
jgi:hypothetical protein